MLDKDNIPKHIAFIMDGNGRWAQEKGLPRTAGHHVGVERVKEIVRAAKDIGVRVVTFFAFSSENWSRPKNEIDILMKFLENFLKKEVKDLNKNNIKLLIIGREDPIPKYLQEKIKEAQDLTKGNSGMVMVLALNYGARQEIVDAVKKVIRSVNNGQMKMEDLDEESFNRYLYTAGLPEPDLLIRTSGEMRLSNFLLWQLSYAELYFPRVYWPDFGKAELEEAISSYQNRNRRFGSIDVNKKNN